MDETENKNLLHAIIIASIENIDGRRGVENIFPNV